MQFHAHFYVGAESCHGTRGPMAPYERTPQSQVTIAFEACLVDDICLASRQQLVWVAHDGAVFQWDWCPHSHVTQTRG